MQHWFSPLVCAVASVMLGAVCMSAAGAPSRYVLVNVAALAVGVVAAVLIRNAFKRSWHFGGTFAVVVALSLFATALLGPRVEGASRWVRIAGLSIQPSLMLLPLAMMFFARSQNWMSSIGVALAGVALSLQPDRAMSGALVAGLAVLWLHRRDRIVALTLAVASLGFASTLLRADHVPPVPFVEGVVQSAFAFSLWAGVAIVAAFVIMLAPAVIGIVNRRQDAAVYGVFGATWAAVIAFAIVGNYPTPLAGYGTSGIVGYCLSSALLTALPRSGDFSE